MNKIINSLKASLLIMWFVVLLGSSLLFGVWHYSDFSQARTISSLQFTKEPNWQIIHFLGGECKCSEFLTEYLVERGPSHEFSEKIIIFDDLSDKKSFYKKLKKKGFNVQKLDYDKTSIENKPEGIPLLVIATPDGRVKYEGGYSNQMLNPFSKIKDLELAKSHMNDEKDIKSLPAYGCYMSKKYKKWLDPVGLKYNK